MRADKPMSAGSRGKPLRQSVLNTAERLLRDGKAEFSMRDLAAAAGVSFATPFNQFGSKAAIMHALSARRIATMKTRFVATPQPPKAVDRVMLAVRIGVDVMLDEPEANRAVMGWLGTAGSSPGTVLAQSSALWRTALGDGEDFSAQNREAALRDLPTMLAFAFRGALSFWTSGELPDEALPTSASTTVLALLNGYTDRPPT